MRLGGAPGSPARRKHEPGIPAARRDGRLTAASDSLTDGLIASESRIAFDSVVRFRRPKVQALLMCLISGLTKRA